MSHLIVWETDQSMILSFWDHPAWASLLFTFKENEPQTEEASDFTYCVRVFGFSLEWLYLGPTGLQQSSGLVPWLCIDSLGKLFIKTWIPASLPIKSAFQGVGLYYFLNFPHIVMHNPSWESLIQSLGSRNHQYNWKLVRNVQFLSPTADLLN